MAGVKRGGSSSQGKTASQATENEEYKTFSGVPDWEKEFKGDGTEEESFFKENSNYDELVKDIKRRGDDVPFEYWSSGVFMTGYMSKLSEKGFDGLDKSTKEWQVTFDHYLDQSEITKGIELRRLSDAQLLLGKGNKTATLEELQALKGRIVTSVGNMSSSAASQGLQIDSTAKKPIEYVIKVPPGTKGAGMWIGDTKLNPRWGNKQREFMFNRDINLKIGDTHYNKQRDVFEVELKYESRNKHDYGKTKTWQKRRKDIYRETDY